jgi:mRNA-degrading endonuclease RelE of RelBE toxin-antitoxin system
LKHRIEWSPEAIDHLHSLSSRQRALVFDAVDRQLAHEPTVQTRNRKILQPNLLAVWELRVGNLRVYYDVAGDPEEIVVVLAVGIKLRNSVRIGGEEVEL